MKQKANNSTQQNNTNKYLVYTTAFAVLTTYLTLFPFEPAGAFTLPFNNFLANLIEELRTTAKYLCILGVMIMGVGYAMNNRGDNMATVLKVVGGICFALGATAIVTAIAEGL